jgi:carboxylate-amine ligase
MTEPSFTVGIEEEYLLVDRQTRDLVQERPAGMMDELERLLEGQVVPEFLNSQLEIGTRVSRTVTEAGDDLKRLRATVARVAEKNGIAMARPTPTRSATTCWRAICRPWRGGC